MQRTLLMQTKHKKMGVCFKIKRLALNVIFLLMLGFFIYMQILKNADDLLQQIIFFQSLN
jgi:hypothetical protein